MRSDVRVAALLLAAGAGRRMGEDNKLLLDYRGEPLVSHLAQVARASHCSEAFVVVGARAEEVTRALPRRGILIVECLDWAAGMASSLRSGVATIAAERPAFDAILVMLADQPHVTAQHLDALIDAHRRAPDAVVASRYAGIEGVPALFPRRCFDALRGLEGDTGARSLLAHERAAHRAVAIEFEAASIDLDTPDDYAALRARDGIPSED